AQVGWWRQALLYPIEKPSLLRTAPWRLVSVRNAASAELCSRCSRLRNHRAVDVAHALHPAQRHGDIEFARENVDGGGHPRLAARPEAIDVGAGHHAGAGPAVE